jgi:hypothetical protein
MKCKRGLARRPASSRPSHTTIHASAPTPRALRVRTTRPSTSRTLISRPSAFAAAIRRCNSLGLGCGGTPDTPRGPLSPSCHRAYAAGDSTTPTPGHSPPTWPRCRPRPRRRRRERRRRSEGAHEPVAGRSPSRRWGGSAGSRARPGDGAGADRRRLWTSRCSVTAPRRGGRGVHLDRERRYHRIPDRKGQPFRSGGRCGHPAFPRRYLATPIVSCPVVCSVCTPNSAWATGIWSRPCTARPNRLQRSPGDR